MVTLFDTPPFANMRNEAKKNKVIDKLNERLVKNKGKLPRHGISVEDFREWCYNPKEFNNNRSNLLRQVDNGIIKKGQLEQIMHRAKDDALIAAGRTTSASFLSVDDSLQSDEYIERKGRVMNLPKPFPTGREKINPNSHVSAARRSELEAALTPDSNYRVMFHMQYWLWSLNKVIYRIPPELWAGSDESVFDIPIHPLLNCPQWSTYIGLSTDQDFSVAPSEKDVENGVHLAIGAFYSIVQLHGKDYMFINLADRSASSKHSNVTVQIYWLLDLSKSTIGEALKAADDVELDDSETPAALRLRYSNHDSGTTGEMLSFFDIINAIFFINTEYKDQVIKENIPRQHAPRRDNQSPYKLNPRLSTVEYVVMEEAATIIRNATGHKSFNGRKAHIRKGHFHGYWTGPRNSDKRIYILKWVMPTFVRGTEVDDHC